jgi:hypothetical protein
MLNTGKNKLKLATTALSLTLLVACGVQPGFPDQFVDKNGSKAPPEPTKKMFVSQSGVTGNFGGIPAADLHCHSDPQKPAGSFRALLVDGANRVAAGAPQRDWVLQPSTLYTRLDGTPIGRTNASSLLIFPLINPISATPAVVWTGLAANWATGAHCAAWANPAATANTGEASSLNNDAAIGAAISCGLTRQVICVQI